MGIGSWTNPCAYPGVEDLRWNCDGSQYCDVCAPDNRDFEALFGVTTMGGYPAFQLQAAGVGASLDRVFIDQSNSLVIFGAHNTILNVPFVSDRFLNLNLP